MKGDTLDATTLPPDGIDLRAELVALQRTRVRQALEQSRGDLAGAARLLGMSPLDLARLAARLDGDAPRSPPPVDEPPVPRIAGGVEFVSAAAIRRYAADGYSEREIYKRLGCNPYLVEKVLREQTERKIWSLDRDKGLSPHSIAARLRLPISRVRRVLERADRQAERDALAHRASNGHNDAQG
jgi:hypothetical protein